MQMITRMWRGTTDIPRRWALPRKQGGPLFVRMLANIMHLLGASGATILIGMATLALMAHALGPVSLGIVAMVESYGKLCDQIFRLETWQSAIRYGAAALEQGHPEHFRRLIKLGMAIDLAGAALAGSVAFLAVPLVARWLYWEPDIEAIARIYSLSLVFGIASTPLGVLRLFDKFAQISWLEPVLAIIRLAGTALIIFFAGSLWTYLLLGMTIMAAQRLILMAMAWRQLAKEGHAAVLTAPLRGTTALFEGYWRFIFAANGTVLIRKTTLECDILVVGSIMGANGAGIYQVVRKLTMAATKLGGTLQQVVFPDLARLWARAAFTEFLIALRNVEILTLVVGVALVCGFALFGGTVIQIIAGSEFEEARTPLMVQSIAVMLLLSGSALRPALMVMGYQTHLLWIVIASASVFFIMLFATVSHFGVLGAPLAHIAFSLVWLPASLALFVSALRSAKAQRQAASADQP